MKVSDDLYGSATRYVSRERLEAMLDRRVGAAAPANSRGARIRGAILRTRRHRLGRRNFAGSNECHGWMAVRYQTRQGGAPHQIVLHVNPATRPIFSSRRRSAFSA